MRHLRNLLILVNLILLLTCQRGLSAHAQGTSPWAPAQVIPAYTDIYPPILVADQNRTVHAFNSELQDDSIPAIFYRQWNIDKGWSLPIDILLPSPSTRDSLRAVVLDPAGRFHMAFYIGSIDQSGDIMYSRALASEADKSQAWSDPIEIGTNAASLLAADLAWFGDNHLTLVYSGIADGVGLYETHSDDGGSTWTEPIRIAVANKEGLWPIHIQARFDDEGRLHVVWGLVGESGIGQRVYYTNRDVDGVSWRSPYLLAAVEGRDYGADWPSIIEYQDQLIAMYMDGNLPDGLTPTRWMRTSKDNGQTWSTPVQPFEQVGENGNAVLLIDSADNLHIILANRVEDPPQAGIWHTIWIGDQWAELDLITPRSPDAAIDSGSYASVGAASRPNAVIVQGNVLLSAWWHDMRDQPPSGYTYTRIKSPELPVIPLPEPASTSTPTSVAMITQATVSPDIVTSTPVFSPGTVTDSGNGGALPQPISLPSVLFIGLLPAFILTVIVVGTHRLRNRSARN